MVDTHTTGKLPDTAQLAFTAILAEGRKEKNTPLLANTWTATHSGLHSHPALWRECGTHVGKPQNACTQQIQQESYTKGRDVKERGGGARTQTAPSKNNNHGSVAVGSSRTQACTVSTAEQPQLQSIHGDLLISDMAHLESIQLSNLLAIGGSFEISAMPLILELGTVRYLAAISQVCLLLPSSYIQLFLYIDLIL